jgi:hypothetical protein
MKRLISVLALAFSFAAYAQGSAAPAGEKPAAEKTEKAADKGDKSDKKAKKAKKAKKGEEGEKTPEQAK